MHVSRGPADRPPRFGPVDILDDQFDELFRGLGEDLLSQRFAHAAALQDQVDFPQEELRCEGPNVPSSFVAGHSAGLFTGCFPNGCVAFPCQFARCLSHQGDVEPSKEPIQQAFARRIGCSGRVPGCAGCFGLAVVFMSG